MSIHAEMSISNGIESISRWVSAYVIRLFFCARGPIFSGTILSNSESIDFSIYSVRAVREVVFPSAGTYWPVLSHPLSFMSLHLLF